MSAASTSPESGLQRERTALAWDRTGVAFLVVGAFMVRVGGAPYASIRHLPAGLAILLGVTLVAIAAQGPGRGSGESASPQARPRLIGLVSAAAVGVSASSFVLVLLAA